MKLIQILPLFQLRVLTLSAYIFVMHLWLPFGFIPLINDPILLQILNLSQNQLISKYGLLVKSCH